MYIGLTNVKRVFFVGGDTSGRAEKLLKMKISLEKEGLQPEFRLFTGNTDKAFRDRYESMIIDNYMSYDECITETKKSGIILDIVKEKQKGLTLRFMESVALSKKLITDNDFDFLFRPKGAMATNFAKSQFDVLVDLNSAGYYPLRQMLYNSGARFRVGRYSDNQPFDLMISIGDDRDANYYFEQILFYLQKFN